MKPQSFDIVILGAGTSACYLLQALAKRQDLRILVLEAGNWSRHPMFRLPVGFTQTFFNRKYNWGFQSEPEAQLNMRSIYCPRGKVVGGSSMINGMIHAIGQAEDYDSWTEDEHCVGWSSREVMPHFRRLFRQREKVTNEPYHLTRTETHPLGICFESAHLEQGWIKSELLHEEQNRMVVGSYHHTIAKGRRFVATYLLPELRKNKNITFKTQSQVHRLRMNQNRVTGIELITKQKELMHLEVTGEVICCLGAIGTPILLQRSGIGPEAVLKRAGIPSKLNLPVGKNLQDHLLIKSIFRLQGIKTINRYKKPGFAFRAFLQYLMMKKGPLCAGASGSGAMLSVFGEQRPDTQSFMAYGSVDDSTHALVPHDFDGITFGTYMMRPESRGTVEINSTDPYALPVIRFNYLSTEKDWTAAIQGLDYQKSIMSHSAFRDFHPQPINDASDPKQYIQKYSESAHHAVGTCKMGRDGVVDASLRVYGLDNLRIADASILPKQISGNTQAISAVIGNRLGEILSAKEQ